MDAARLEQFYLKVSRGTRSTPHPIATPQHVALAMDDQGRERRVYATRPPLRLPDGTGAYLCQSPQAT